MNFEKVVSKALNESHEWVLITDKEGHIVYANDAVEKISGYKKDEIIGKTPKIFSSERQNAKFYDNFWNMIKNGETFEDVFINKTKDGREFYLLNKVIPVDNYYIAIGKDITKEIKYKSMLDEIQLKDELTGLWNKNGFFRNMQGFIEKNVNKVHLLCLLDIYDFRVVNHQYGIETGDMILKEIARRLKVSFFDKKLIMFWKKNDNIVLGRFNGDEFGIFFANATDSCHKNIADKINVIFMEPFIIGKQKIHLNYNLGFAYYPYDADDEKLLYNNASIALSNAKKSAPNCFRFYSSKYTDEINMYNNAQKLIETAFENNEFEMFFQPYVNTDNEKITGYESLIRIVKENEVISPYYFIKVLEKSNLMPMVDLKMLDQIDNFMSQHDKKVSFNLSERSFNNKKVVEKIKKIGAKYKNRFIIELVERIFIDDIGYTKSVLNEFKSESILIAMDDFGTGYSSLSYLKEFDLDILKIDISFIKTIIENKENYIITESIVNLSKKLGIKSLAEGIETKRQLSVLKNMGVDYLQGYYFYKPMNMKEALKVVHEN